MAEKQQDANIARAKTNDDRSYNIAKTMQYIMLIALLLGIAATIYSLHLGHAWQAFSILLATITIIGGITAKFWGN